MELLPQNLIHIRLIDFWYQNEYDELLVNEVEQLNGFFVIKVF